MEYDTSIFHAYKYYRGKSKLGCGSGSGQLKKRGFFYALNFENKFFWLFQNFQGRKWRKEFLHVDFRQFCFRPLGRQFATVFFSMQWSQYRSFSQCNDFGNANDFENTTETEIQMICRHSLHFLSSHKLENFSHSLFENFTVSTTNWTSIIFAIFVRTINMHLISNA